MFFMPLSSNGTVVLLTGVLALANILPVHCDHRPMQDNQEHCFYGYNLSKGNI